jgi:hypothetical protein
VPRIKGRSTKIAVDREEHFAKALKAPNDGTFSFIASAFNLPKSSPAHRRNGRQNRHKAHEVDRIFSPTAERQL